MMDGNVETSNVCMKWTDETLHNTFNMVNKYILSNQKSFFNPNR